MIDFSFASKNDEPEVARLLGRSELAPEGVRSTTQFSSHCPSSSICMKKDIE